MLLSQIADGSLPPGAEMPSERVLADRYTVARMTARAALRELERVGAITPGNPRRVAQYRPMVVHVTRTADRLAPGESATLGADSWLADALAAGETPHPRVKVFTTTDAQAATRLGLSPDASLIARQNTRMLKRGGLDEPHNMITFWFPAAVAEGTPLGGHQNIEEGSLAWLEREYGLLHHRVRVSARMPTHDEAVALRILQGPVQIVWRTSWVNGRMLVTSMAVYPADRIELELDL